MPEIKNQFTGGKMNKDLDERLVPKGEYRNAMNIQVSTSEDSDVGALQNILGNKLGCTYNSNNLNPIQLGSHAVGSISDEKNDSLYWMVAGPGIDNNFLPLTVSETVSLKDMIMRTNANVATGCEPVFVDKWKFCTGITPSSSTNITNAILLDDDDLYSNITTGMHATGFIGTSQAFGPTLVKNVGYIDKFSAHYSSFANPAPVLGSSSPTAGFRIRSFENPTVTSSTLLGLLSNALHMRNYLYENHYAGTGGAHPQPNNPPGNNQVQLLRKVSSGTLPAQFMPGSTIQVGNSSATNLFGTSTIVSVNMSLLQDSYNPANSAAFTNYYVITITPTLFPSISSMPATPPFGWGLPSQIKTFGTNIATATSTQTATPTPSNKILVQHSSYSVLSSSSWLNEIYQTFYQVDPTTNLAVSTGAEMRIDHSIGSGGNFPMNSCIDPTSVNAPDLTDPANPIYDDEFDIVCCDLPHHNPNDPTNCTPGTANNALQFPPPKQGKPLTFRTNMIGGIKSVFLNGVHDLNGVDSICFESDRVLNFDSSRLITGINIVDDMLFWTDNFSEPKKINILRSVTGTDFDGDTHTALENPNTGVSLLTDYSPIREEHVTVIRKNPKNALNLELFSGRNDDLNYNGVVQTVVSGGVNPSPIIGSSNITAIDDFSSLSIGDKIKIQLQASPQQLSVAWAAGDFLLLKEFTKPVGSLSEVSPAIPITNFRIRGLITDWVDNNFDVGIGNIQVEIQIVGIKDTPPSPDASSSNNILSYAIDLENKQDKIFENKLPRFSYRYKYADGEYSTFAPWSEVAFLPSSLSYDASGGFNKGMTNHVRSIKVKGFKTTYNNGVNEDDITEIDILYKEDSSPSVYIVETIGALDIAPIENVLIPWYANEYEIKSETIKSLLPSNQLLRPWDNVPKKALAQEVTGSRLVYANYEQNYDLKIGDQNFKPNFQNYLDTFTSAESGSPVKSIKSLRDYKIGVVFSDEYGRETPVLISESGGFKVSKINSDKANKLAVGLQDDPPQNMSYFKFYIKETSAEYYNLAMDRWYDAEDGNIWLAFPSSERNKVDLETSLYFKKGSRGSVIENDTKYKILAIENEAPDFIKTRKIRIGRTVHNPSQIVDGVAGQLFGVDTDELRNAPVVGEVSFEMNYNAGRFINSSISHLDDLKENIYIQFVSSDQFSDQYKISSITSNRKVSASGATTDPTKYFVTLDTNLKEDINFIFQGSSIEDDIKVQFTKEVVENKPKFDGRFFAKIENDGQIKVQLDENSVGVNYVEKASRDIFVLDDDETLRSRSLHTFVSHQGEIAVTKSYNNDDWTDGIQYRATSLSNNPSGVNWNYYIARQSYFGGFNSTMENNFINTTSGYIRNLFGNSRKLENPGVWFINRSTKKYKPKNNSSYPNSLWWDDSVNMNEFSPACNLIGHAGGCNDNDPGHDPTWKIGGGIVLGTEDSYMNIAFGGIDKLKGDDRLQTKGNSNTKRYQVGDGFSKRLNNYFSIGEGTDKSGEYGDANTTGFTKRLSAGFQFKWEEDPTETVYTIVNQTDTENNVRFGRHDAGGGAGFIGALSLQDGPSSYHKNWGFSVTPSMAFWNPAGGVGSYMAKGLSLGSGTVTTTATNLFIAKDLIGTITNSAINFIVGDGSTPNADGIEIGMQIINGTTANAFSADATVTGVDYNTGEINIDNAAVNLLGGTNGDDIEFAFTIRLKEEYIYGHTNTSEPEVNYIVVDRISTKCSNANTARPQYDLKKGMMLDAYNLDSTLKKPGTASRDNNIVILNVGDYDQSLNSGNGGYKIDLSGYHTPLHANDNGDGPFDNIEFKTANYTAGFEIGERVRFRQVTMNGASSFTESNTFNFSLGGSNPNAVNVAVKSGGICAVGYKMIMVEPIDQYGDEGNLPPDPFVWETEPKDTKELDLYYEISENNPLVLNTKTIKTAIPIGSVLTNRSGEGFPSQYSSAIVANNESQGGDEIILDTGTGATFGLWVGNNPANPLPAPDGTLPIRVGDKIQITRPSGVTFDVVIAEILPFVGTPITTGLSNHFRLSTSIYDTTYYLNWHNCYSFGNGVESNRIKDSFNSPFMANGVKVSTTLSDDYKAERRKHGLIYSGIYNSSSGVNNLNQFIQAESITKDINPVYGSIQKLHSGWGQSGDLIALCEDRILKILANKDALFNADGNTNVTATNKVLGTAMPYSGEFGISKNPESFASESYRAYFTDKVRGSVMRLSIDGLTPISSHGMNDWFKDHLKLTNRLVGSYDDRKNEYNITLFDINETVSFKEDVKGWVSFKSFIPEMGISCADDYYTFINANLYKHHDKDQDRNTFYSVREPSAVTVILNDSPGTVKDFYTINYEGSQGYMQQVTNYNTFDRSSWLGTFDSNGEPIYGTVSSNLTASEIKGYNLQSLNSEIGWQVEKIETDKEEGSIKEFIEKEGKWFNYIKGK